MKSHSYKGIENRSTIIIFADIERTALKEVSLFFIEQTIFDLDNRFPACTSKIEYRLRSLALGGKAD